MRLHFKLGFLALLFVFTANLSSVWAQTKQSGPTLPRYRNGTVLLKPRPGVAVAELAREHGALRAHAEHTFPLFGNLQIVKLPEGLSVEDAVGQYRRTGLVEYAEPDYELEALVTPNDPQFIDGTLWGMNQIDAPGAWDTRTSAEPVIVAVIDTGVRYTHEDLAANMWSNTCVNCPVGGVVYSNDVYGINAIANTGDPWDDNGHGTHVSGTIGAIGNNNLGVVGVAWKVKIMALKFLNSGGTGYTSDAVKCINYAIAKGAKVMSNSWGGGGYSTALRDAIVAARNADIVFVAAAGNNSANNDSSPFYPADYDVDNIVAVAATDQSDGLASFSNFGLNTVELAAPGLAIYSSYNSSDSGYATLSGTSMACPHVAGAAALLRAQFPAMTYAEVIDRVLATTDPFDDLANQTVSGGRLNVRLALTEDPVAYFTASPALGEPPLTVTFTDQSIGAITTASLDFGDGSAPVATANTSHTYDSEGTYHATLSVAGPNGTSTRTRPITVAHNYSIVADTFGWVDTTGMTPLALTDDSTSPAQPLPFTFSFYGQPCTNLYITSNGFLLLGSSVGGTTYINADMPNLAMPNAVIAPYWDDLNPDFGGQIRFGTIGTAPNRVVVASWEGIPPYGDFSDTCPLTFQVLLFEGSNDIKIQYLEVQPTNLTYGAGRSATVGVENQSGVLARKYCFNGSSLLANSQAIRFTMSSTPPPAGVLAVTPAAGFSALGTVGGPFSPYSKSYTLSNTGGQTINWTASHDPSQTWLTVSPAGGALAAGAITTITASINSTANSLAAGNYSDTLSFTNTTNGNGNTSRPVALTVNAPAGVLSVAPSDGLSASGVVGGPFSPSSKVYTLSNSGGQSIDWTASHNPSQSWLTLSASSGTLAAGAGTTVTVSINSAANSLLTGNYSDTLSFTNTTNGNGNTSRPVALTVNTGCALNPPSNLVAATSGPSFRRVVVLTWIDTSACETAYQVERAIQNLNGTWTSYGVVSGDLPPNFVSYTDSTVSRGQRYRFRVRALNGATTSGYSGTVELKVP